MWPDLDAEGLKTQTETPRNRSQAYLFNSRNLNSSTNLYASLILITLIQFISPSCGQSSISLNTAQWFVSNSNKSIVLPAQIPGGIYTDLRRNKVLKQDILYGKNDQAYRWVGNENWTYTTSFTIDHYIARSQSVKLVLHGVDTISSVYLNGQEIGYTDNMFVRYRFDIKPHLKLAGLENILAIRFESPIRYSARKSNSSLKQNRGKVIPPYCPSPAQRGECHVNFIRKMQASFSWDWGPAFPSMGIYKDIEIEYGSFGHIRDILVDTRRLPALVPQTRTTTAPPPVIISSSIRQQLRNHAINRTVPYIRGPPFYVPIGADNQHLLHDPQPVEPVSTFEVNQQLLEENWLLKITLVAEMVRPDFGYNLRVEFNLNNVLHYESEHVNVVANSDGFIRLGFNLRIDTTRLRIRPWWPNNAGTQTLYRLTARMLPIPNPPNPPAPDRVRQKRGLMDRSPTMPVDYRSHSSQHVPLQYRSQPPRTPATQPMMFLASQFDASVNQLQHVSEKEIVFGFRTVELIQESVTKNSPEDGITFNFRINGVDLFAMGTNWIPSSVLPENSNDLEYIRYLLQSVKDANMNMIRVWGGGMYESDEFYKMADEMGIMIWHDFMFACALYPVEDDFLSSVRLEIEQQVQRLQHHPSIVLWAGNNENEMALTGPWWPEVALWSKSLREQYGKLYVETIKPIVQILDPTRPYVESSPSNGPLSSAQPNAIGRVPNDNRYGDVHHYDYFADSFDWTNYPSTRFASEYGFQSYPSFNALTSISSPIDWKYPITANLLHRQHRLTGEAEMKLQIKLHFNDVDPGGVDKFKSFLYISQLTQAIAIKTETEFFRRNRFVDPETKLGKTMGALYWQLNDVWQAPTWSSIEYGGKWKMLHYFARRFFFPIQVMPFLIQPQTSVGGLVQQVLSSGSGVLSSALNRSYLFSSSMANNQDALTSFQQQMQQQQLQSSLGPVFAVDLVRDDLFYLLDSFNVTIKFYRWTSFAPVWQDTIYVKHTRPQNVTRIYEQDMNKIVRQPGVVSLSSGVFQVILEQQPRLGLSQIDNYLMPVVPRKVTAMRVAKISAELIQGPFELADVRSESGGLAGDSRGSSSSAQWSCAYRMTLVSDAIAMFVWLDLNFINVEPSEHGRAPGDSFDPLERNEPKEHHRRPQPPENIQLEALPPERLVIPIRDDSTRDHPPESIHLSINNHRDEGREGRRSFDHPDPNGPHKIELGLPHNQTFRPLPNTGSSILRYQFSDNAFNMFEPSKVIDLYLSRCLTKSQVEAALEIQSLANSL